MARTEEELVRIAIGGEIVEVPSKAARDVRGALIGMKAHGIARKFAVEEDEIVVLARSDERAVLGAVSASMKQGSDQRARDLLALRNALQAELGRHA
jgi:hypothetical protein